jgi:hypothetical protein
LSLAIAFKKRGFVIGEEILRKRTNLIGGGILDVNRTARYKLHIDNFDD